MYKCLKENSLTPKRGGGRGSGRKLNIHAVNAFPKTAHGDLYPVEPLAAAARLAPRDQNAYTGTPSSTRISPGQVYCGL